MRIVNPQAPAEAEPARLRIFLDGHAVRPGLETEALTVILAHMIYKAYGSWSITGALPDGTARKIEIKNER